MKKYFTTLFLAIVMVALPITAIAAEGAPEALTPVVQKAAASEGTQITLILEEMDERTRGYVTNHMAYRAKKAAAKKKAAEAPKDIAESQIVAKVIESITPENIQTWGTALAEGIKSVCHTLNIEVNEFIKTDVGKLTAGMLIYYVVGDDVIKFTTGAKDIFFTLAGYMFCIIVVLFSFHKLHLPRKKYTYTANDRGKMIRSKDYTWEYPGDSIFSNEDKHRYIRIVSAASHVFIFLLLTLIAGVNV